MVWSHDCARRFTICATLCLILLVGCSERPPKDVDGPGTHHDASVEAGLGGRGGQVGITVPLVDGGAPSGCVFPGELNEFFLPLCTDEPDAPARCKPGFDELGRPVCVDDAGVPLPPPDLACVRKGLCKQLVLTGGGRLDVLFMVDNSGSMAEEQDALVEEMPALIGVLTSGDVDGDGVQDFPAVKDLHLGVISSDMGLVGISGIGGCQGVGDDGLLLHTPSPAVAGCASNYPKFLSYDASQVDPAQAAKDFECIATLGTLGCGFEQQLEAVLKALTPSTSDRRFHGLDGATTGHGDGANAGFLRPDSLLAIVLVSDEDDCSAREPRLFTPAALLPPDDPLRMQSLNLRCHDNPQNLFDVSRYVNGLLELRPPGSGLVLFAAIVGVPPELVDETARAGVDFSDASARAQYYDALLAAPLMQPTPDPALFFPNGNLIPSCSTDTGLAYPPQRIVQVARGFGENGIVQSICQGSFAPAMRPLVDRISQSLTVGCLPVAFARDASGRVPCDVVWELPLPGTPQATLTDCKGRPFLTTPTDPAQRFTEDGRARCLVNQVPVKDGAVKSGLSGFYYDDFSSEAIELCGASSDQRVVFTSDVQPPIDVRAYVDCSPSP